MKAAEWIDRLKVARGWESDYRVSKELSVRPQTVSRYRVDASTLDENIAIKVAQALGEKPEIILLDQVMERSKNDDARAAIGRALKRIGGVAASILLVTGMGGIPNADAGLARADQPGQDIHRRKSNKKKRGKHATDWLIDFLSPGLALSPQ